jgi:protein-S-isoprenylcysteine O-methyltransferase Ste14
MLYLRYFAWLACSVYCTIPAFWLIIHPFTDRWRRRGRDSYRIILPLWLLFIVTAAAFTYPALHRTLYRSPIALIPGAALIALGFFVYSRSFVGFNKIKVSGLAELEPDRHDQSLVVSGIRSRIRHPLYLGHLLEVLGWCVATGSISLLALALFAMITGALMLRLEDRELESRFGASYRDYRGRTPVIIPRLR